MVALKKTVKKKIQYQHALSTHVFLIYITVKYSVVCVVLASIFTCSSWRCDGKFCRGFQYTTIVFKIKCFYLHFFAFWFAIVPALSYGHNIDIANKSSPTYGYLVWFECDKQPCLENKHEFGLSSHIKIHILLFKFIFAKGPSGTQIWRCEFRD